jgi:hypothetical protein
LFHSARIGHEGGHAHLHDVACKRGGRVKYRCESFDERSGGVASRCRKTPGL